MKRILSLLLVAAIILSIACVPAFAATPATPVVSLELEARRDNTQLSDLNQLKAGDIITAVVKITDIPVSWVALQIQLNFPGDYVEYVKKSFQYEDIDTLFKFVQTNPEKSNRDPTGSIITVVASETSNFEPEDYADYVNDKGLIDVEVMRVQFSVKENVHGKMDFSIEPGNASSTTPYRIAFLEEGQTTKVTDFNPDPAKANELKVEAVAIQELTEVTLPATDITPKKGETAITKLAGEAEGDKYDADVTWTSVPSHEGNVFAANTAYTATITITPKTGYLFTENTTLPTFDGFAFKLENGKIVGTREYEATADKSVTSLTITSQPNKKDYVHGEPFDSTGLVVKAAYDDGTEDTNVTDYSVVYPDGESQQYFKYEDSSVSISYGGCTAVISDITVAQKPLTIKNPQPVSREYQAGNTKVAVTGELDGVVGNENVTIEDMYLTVDSPNAGSRSVQSVNVTLGGDDMGNYTLDETGLNSLTPSITQKNINSGDITVTIPPQEYDGAMKTANVSITDKDVNGDLVSLGAGDFIAKTENAVAVGGHSVTIEGQGNYCGTRTETFTITAKRITVGEANVDMDPGYDLTYDGKEKDPLKGTITVQDGERKLVLKVNEDYTAQYIGDLKSCGTITVVFNPMGNYIFDQFRIEYSIKQKEIKLQKGVNYFWVPSEEADSEKTDLEFEYDGLKHGIKVEFAKSLNGAVEAEYSGVYEATNAGNKTAAVTFKIANENYKFSADSTTNTTHPWKINQKLYTGDFKHTETVRYDNTTEQKVSVTALGLPADSDYSARPNTDSITIHDTEDLIKSASFDKESRMIKFQLNENLDKTKVIGKTATIGLQLWAQNYKATEQADSCFTVTLTVQIIDKAPATVTVTKPTTSMTYGDAPVSINSSWTADDTTKPTYIVTGDSVTVDENGSMTAVKTGDSTITVKYESESHIGTKQFTVTVSPKPITVKAKDVTIGYGDAIPTTFAYELADGSKLVGSDKLAKLGIIASTSAMTESPQGTYDITLNAESANKNYDYTLRTGTLTITAKAIDASNITVVGVPTEVTYNGAQQKPEDGITVKLGETALTKGRDYTLSYGENKNAGTGTVTVKLTGNYSGEKTVEFTISPKELTITNLAVETRPYNGKTDATLTGALTGVCDGDSFDIVFPAAEFENKHAETNKVVTVDGDFDITPKGDTRKSNYALTQPNKTGLTGTIIAIDPGTAIRTEVTVRYNDTSLWRAEVGASGIISGDKPISGSITLTKSADASKFAHEPTVNCENGAVEFKLANGLPDQDASIVCKATLNYGANYTDVVEFDFTIKLTKRQPQSELGYSGTTSMTYGQSLRLDPSKVTGGSGTGAIGFSVGAADGTIVENVFMPSHAGSISLTITKGADSSYASASKTIIITVNPAAVPVEPTYTEITTSGKTFADVGLTFPGFTGKVEWKDANGNVMLPTDEVRVNTEYTWVFTPDNTNYAPATGKLTPYVDNSLIYLPGIIGGSSKFNFHDVNRFDYYYDAVKWAVDSDITSGTARFTFSPDAVCTRAQTVTFLWRAAGSPLPRYRTTSFTDVSPNAYYYNAVLWAVEQGITTGLTATTFGPDATVTRGQVAAFLYRAAAASRPNTFNPFTDVKASAYNYDAILWAYDNRITTGTSTTTFSPDAPCTRAQIVTFLYRFYQGR